MEQKKHTKGNQQQKKTTENPKEARRKNMYIIVSFFVWRRKKIKMKEENKQTNVIESSLKFVYIIPFDDVFIVPNRNSLPMIQLVVWICGLVALRKNERPPQRGCSSSVSETGVLNESEVF